MDSLDTLYIAGLMDEYKQGRDWVEQSLHFDQVSGRYQLGCGLQRCLSISALSQLLIIVLSS